MLTVTTRINIKPSQIVTNSFDWIIGTVTMAIVATRKVDDSSPQSHGVLSWATFDPESDGVLSWATFDPESACVSTNTPYAVSNIVGGQWTTVPNSMSIPDPMDKDAPAIFTIPDTRSDEISSPFLRACARFQIAGHITLSRTPIVMSNGVRLHARPESTWSTLKWPTSLQNPS